MIALGLHCTMDELGIVFGDNLLGHPDAGLLLGVSLHKVPEGLALILLFLGSGFERRKAVLWAVGAESMTIVGGIVGSEFLASIFQDGEENCAPGRGKPDRQISQSLRP